MQEWTQLLPLLLIVIVGWFLIIRPMRNRQRKMATIQRNLAVGSRIMLTSGIFGDVEALDENIVQLGVAPRTTITVSRQVVAEVIEPIYPAADDE